MKKITLLSALLFTAYVNAQDTFAIYTEDTSLGTDVPSLRFSNGQGFAITEPETAPFEGNKNYLLTFNGTSSYYHGIFFPRNEANTADVTVDVSAFSYYNIAIKTASVSPFYLRMRGAGITAKVLINETNTYGFVNDNEWHQLSIPIVDFIPESATFSLTSITEILVLRSNAEGSVATTGNDFEIDNIYLSTEQLGTPQQKQISLSLYPNPAAEVVNIASPNTIDTVSIYNMLGQKVLETKIGAATGTVNITSLQDGIYNVNATSGVAGTTIKLIKK